VSHYTDYGVDAEAYAYDRYMKDCEQECECGRVGWGGYWFIYDLDTGDERGRLPVNEYGGGLCPWCNSECGPMATVCTAAEVAEFDEWAITPEGRYCLGEEPNAMNDPMVALAAMIFERDHPAAGQGQEAPQ
jgi:hypothetical protein